MPLTTSGCDPIYPPFLSRVARVLSSQEMWEGALPPLLAHHRQFPSESGAYVRLKEPITVRGTICRADWVDGASNVCRDKLEGGEERQEDWQPSDCSVCAFFSVSPCNGIFNR